ncbi:hypothetical protein ACFQ09_21090 [Massilia norwichensis]|jgi:hypothetical protein|uniref:Uncharacterized protein n=1 Tax=Massilia norwichensis TaxID=1442366 RepID=A0ABT2A7I9_9BURK|nr:hypothetical protein [Massilia norwichensis]MCS0590164.1 hypothetical protein [Massilia norwichensis]
MNKPQVCMFCRYRKSRALDAEACCAAAELARPAKEGVDHPMQGMARGMPERLRAPNLPQYRPR